MTLEASIKKAADEFKAHQAAQAAYFKASLERAEALGRGDATEEQRLELVALRAAYYA